jgi:hypothetical protein
MYSFDTSALMDGWVRSYPPDVWPSLWHRVEQLAAEGSVVVTEEVFRELGKKADDLHEWVKARPSMIVAVDADHIARVKSYLSRWPRLVDSKKNRSGADPFVIALAEQRNIAVVTGENATGSLIRPRIPDVCDQIHVRHTTFLGMVREQGWRF